MSTSVLYSRRFGCTAAFRRSSGAVMRLTNVSTPSTSSAAQAEERAVIFSASSLQEKRASRQQVSLWFS